MTTNKKDKTEDILEKVKDVLEKKMKKERVRDERILFFESVSISRNINYISLNNPTTFPNTVTLSR